MPYHRSEEHTSELQSPCNLVCRIIDRKSTRLNSSHLVISYAVSLDRKSTRLNSSHLVISYAVFCLKKKKKQTCLQPRVPTAAPPATESHRSASQILLDSPEKASARPPRDPRHGIRIFFFFFNDPAPPEIYTLSLPAALPICVAEGAERRIGSDGSHGGVLDRAARGIGEDRIRNSAGGCPAVGQSAWAEEVRPDGL